MNEDEELRKILEKAFFSENFDREQGLMNRLMYGITNLLAAYGAASYKTGYKIAKEQMGERNHAGKTEV